MMILALLVGACMTGVFVFLVMLWVRVFLRPLVLRDTDVPVFVFVLAMVASLLTQLIQRGIQ